MATERPQPAPREGARERLSDPAFSRALQRTPVGGLAQALPGWEPAAWPVAPDWQGTVDAFFSSAAGLRLGDAVAARIADGATVYPSAPLRALELTPLQAVRVVILGQDPYHGPGQAHGLAFSVDAGVPAPPSLRNIHAEIVRERNLGDLQAALGPRNASTPVDLTPWARQGVLLLNTCLTVERGRPASHSQLGWEVLTGSIIDAIQRKSDPVVFLLWGRHAQHCQPRTDAAPPGAARLYLRSNHPSPLSARRPPAPFLGCGHFAQTNNFLQSHGAVPVDW